ncbi:MAG: hypothetical protein JOZ33_17920, partial [Acidobacteriaceae bacterium]|nr:hypothetical protein [Acidobacteriaceae bacterium]
MLSRRTGSVLVAAVLLGWATCRAETGAEGWLRYAPVVDAQVKARYQELPDIVVSLDDSPQAHSAQTELVRGITGMIGRQLRTEKTIPAEGAFVLGTVTEVKARFPNWKPAASLKPEGLSISMLRESGHAYWLIVGADTRGILYGTFRMLQEMAEQHDLTSVARTESPSAPV